MEGHTGDASEACESDASGSGASSSGQAQGKCCFGVDPREDGTVLVASQEGQAAKIRKFQPGQAATVVQFVHETSRAPRVCVASTGGEALRLALAIGELPQAEVILLRPAALSHRAGAGHVDHETETALALARYARHAA